MCLLAALDALRAADMKTGAEVGNTEAKRSSMRVRRA